MTDQQSAPPTEPGEPAALTHQRPDGAVLMVDVTDKPVTKRTAHATATVITRADVIDLLVAGDLPKGEALATARIAGIMGAKQTSALIPLCHPLPLSGATVDFETLADRVIITTRVKTTGVTGVEMEALTAASVAALTLYDMVKAVDKHAQITDIRVLSKSGGKSGDWVAP
ncbi:cyclic pyranopterin monophosphate synthase MoaC [Subtercola sp. YIM 133946]|uniref:cyclic pyranopterin monophosphate synthase MoaC n=1 Tax=Subtercola sp. YIM 133946 TaxID=3118909 RepID=UPI002F946E78